MAQWRLPHLNIACLFASNSVVSIAMNLNRRQKSLPAGLVEAAECGIIGARFFVCLPR